MNAPFGLCTTARLVLGTSLGLLGTGGVWADVPAEPAGAVAFVRVYGQISLDLPDDREGPEALDYRELGTGTAFVVAPSGLLLTNHHVVTGGRFVQVVEGLEIDVTLAVERVEVWLARDEGSESYDASVVASDADLDLAVLQVTGLDLPHLPLGDSEAVQAGDRMTVLGFPFGRAVEVGRSLDEDRVPTPTVTTGSLSAARVSDDSVVRYLQTDATVYPGSSGGPMLDEEGFVVGVVTMKLGPDARVAGPAFGVPVNLVKDFLEGHGLLHTVPGTRLPPGVVHDLDWKGLRVELPDGARDESGERLRVDTGESGGPVSFLAARVATPATLSQLEKALLRGRLVRGFVPAEASDRRLVGLAQVGRVQSSARGTTPGGARFALEYALLEVGSGREKVLARFLGPAEEVAFNRGALRRSLQALEAHPLLSDEIRAPLAATFEPSVLKGRAESIFLPAGWAREAATRAACVLVPPAESGVASRPPGDFTVTLRMLRWPTSAIRPEQVARACGQPKGTPPLAYTRRYRPLGVDTGIWGAFIPEADGVLLLEVEAPQAKLPFVRDLYTQWLARVAVSP